MPANLTPEYRAAADALRRARDPELRLECLREMLRVIPKHKGTDHLQGDLKRRIRELEEELAGPRKGGARGGPALVVRPEGAAQIALLGPPNGGKSLLHARLSGSGARVAPFPFTTQYPEPGMMTVGDVQLQLVDLPPLAARHPVSWIGGTLQSADAALLVVDVTEPGIVQQVAELRAELAERRVGLGARWPADPTGDEPDEVADDPFFRLLPTLLVANKADLDPDAAEDAEALEELAGLDFPVMVVSAQTGAGVEALGPWLFARLGLIRVYTKVPGKPPDRGRPFVLRPGGTVADVARLVHRDLADQVRFARLWNATHDGHHAGREHPVADGDVIELHA